MIARQGLSPEDIEESPKKCKAYYPPRSPAKALQIFRFLRKNDNHVTSVSGGMSGMTTGLDKSALIAIAPAYKLDLTRYMHLVDIYEQGMLTEQARILNATK